MAHTDAKNGAGASNSVLTTGSLQLPHQRRLRRRRLRRRARPRLGLCRSPTYSMRSEPPTPN